MEENNKQHNEDHGSSKDFTIIVNTREKKWTEKEISYEEVIQLAFDSYDNNETTVYTITYSRGEDSHKEGFLLKGEKVKVKNGMIFNVTQTNKS